ncbi:hypothetical protein MOQ67_13095 [Pseudomonas sp. LY-1]
MNIKQKLILAFAVVASLPVILVAVLIILNVHEVLHRADHDRVVSRHWEGLTPRNQTVGGGLPPIAVVQLQISWLFLRHRGQAPSHMIGCVA